MGQFADALSCPTCGKANDEPAFAGIWLRNPVDCDEFAVVVRCPACRSCYLEVEESGEQHPDGPEYRTSGPYTNAQTHAMIDAIRQCLDPFDSWCVCASHALMLEIVCWRNVPPELNPSDGTTDESFPYLRRLDAEGSRSVTRDEAEAIRNQLEAVSASVSPETSVTMHYHSMRWARQKLRPPAASP